METHTHHNRNAPHSVATAWINSFTVLQTEVRFIFIFPLLHLLHADRVCWWIDHWLHSRFSLLVRSQGLVPPICEQPLSKVKKKEVPFTFSPLASLPPSSVLPSYLLPSLPPSLLSIKCSVSGATCLSASLKEQWGEGSHRPADSRRSGMQWSPVCFPVHLCRSWENKQ